MKFKTNKRILIVAVSLPCALSMVGCMNNKEAQQVVDSRASVSSSSVGFNESTTYSESVNITQTTDPSSYEDLVGVTLPNNKLSMNDYDVSDFYIPNHKFAGVGLGYGNPKLLSCVRKYFSNNTLNTEDIPCYSSTDANYDAEFFGICDSDDLCYIRYVLEENDLRMWMDEIPYDFFLEKFPEYVDSTNKEKYKDLSADYGDYFIIDGKANGYNGSLISVSNDSSKDEMLNLACFIQLVNYNRSREAVAVNVSDNNSANIKYGLIETGVTSDGKWVWCPTEDQYNLINSDTHKLPKCENVDILIPETREDLIASGIDVEKYDEMCEKVFGGAKMEKNKTQDDQSRSRQG